MYFNLKSILSDMHYLNKSRQDAKLHTNGMQFV